MPAGAAGGVPRLAAAPAFANGGSNGYSGACGGGGGGFDRLASEHAPRCSSATSAADRGAGSERRASCELPALSPALPVAAPALDFGGGHRSRRRHGARPSTAGPAAYGQGSAAKMSQKSPLLPSATPQAVSIYGEAIPASPRLRLLQQLL